MSLEPVFGRSDFKSHMPFCDGETLLFCQSDRTVRVQFEYAGTIQRRVRSDSRLREQFENVARPLELEFRDWKLAYASWKERIPRRLVSGLPENAIECSPAFFREGNEWHVSFIGGIPGRREIHYRLYEMSGPSLEELSPARIVSDWPARAGFVSPLHICLARGGRLHLTDRQSQEEHVINSPFSGILRASFSADLPERLIITGLDEQQQISTLLHQIDDHTTWELDPPGEAYKPSIWGDRILFASRLADDFEDRAVRETQLCMRPSERAFRVETSVS